MAHLRCKETVEKMDKVLLLPVAMSLLLGTGCTTAPSLSHVPKEPESPVRMLCENGEYHHAMRALPKAMAKWREYTKRTGRTAEGAAGFEYATTMFAIAHKGDAHWGRILDDPGIPYEYKTDMIFEILEARLGKGAVYVGNKDNLIVPRKALIDLKEMIKLPE